MENSYKHLLSYQLRKAKHIAKLYQSALDDAFTTFSRISIQDKMFFNDAHKSEYKGIEYNLFVSKLYLISSLRAIERINFNDKKEEMEEWERLLQVKLI